MFTGSIDKILHGNMESAATSATSSGNNFPPKLTFIHVEVKIQ